MAASLDKKYSVPENQIEQPIEDEQEKPLTLDQRRTQELVFAMVAPIGSGASTVANLIKKKIEENFSYKTNIIKISDIINNHAESVGAIKVDAVDSHRVEKLQDIGNKLREKHSNDVLGILSIDQIYKTRSDNESGEDRRYCTIIDSLKNPEEVAVLRKVYGDLFWLIGVFSPEEKEFLAWRITYLTLLIYQKSKMLIMMKG